MKGDKRVLPLLCASVGLKLVATLELLDERLGNPYCLRLGRGFADGGCNTEIGPRHGCRCVVGAELTRVALTAKLSGTGGVIQHSNLSETSVYGWYCGRRDI